MNMNQYNYNNVITFPDGKPYTISNANALIFSLTSMTAALSDMEDIFKQILQTMNTDITDANPN